MSSRDAILKAVHTNQPGEVVLPSLHFDSFTNRTEHFVQLLETIGASVNLIEDYSDVESYYGEQTGKGLAILCFIESLSSDTFDSITISELEKTDQLFIEGAVAVAENGAIWIGEKAMGHRAAPFLCQHLVIVIKESAIVATMHDAYKIIDTTAEGFGAFIAGPSKTADIEQSLVIGAHGPVSLKVFIITEYNS